MFSHQLHARIFRMAQAQGLPTEGAPAEAPLPPEEALPEDPHSLWGPRLAALAASGHWPSEALPSLAWEAIGGEAGSWVDPLFRGPAPLGGLPGLGDRYRELELLGEGATARVFRAMDTLLQRPVALKVLMQPSAAALAEARAQARVDHPNVCRVYGVGQDHIVLQLVEGPTLSRAAPGLGLAEKVRVVRDIARGVDAAHQKGLVHLDLKLDNILTQVDAGGALHPVVGDFGMVRTEGGMPDGYPICPMGTPPYTSPEQLAGDPSRLDRRSDVYSLGVLLYVLLAGAIPFQASDFPSLLEAMAHTPPVPLRQRVPGLPRDLARIVHRCLEKAPEARYSGAGALSEDLDRFLAHRPVAAMGGGFLYRTGRWLRRNRRLALVAGLGLAVLLGTSLLQVRHAGFLTQQADWDHHFQGLVEDLRTRLDRIYRLPAHDIEPELAQARGFLRRIETEMARRGPAAEGPGRLALGQAMLLLNPGDPGAGAQFQKAWDLGFRTEGARTWLAFSLVEQYRWAQWTVYREKDKEAEARLRAELVRRYLEPARTLLQGKGGSDQARLAHLAEKAELRARRPLDPRRLLSLARAFRAQFPDDVEAMLEEAEALSFLADGLWSAGYAATSTWPPPCAAEVDPLRREAEATLLQAHAIAPSHPRVCLLLSSLFINLDQSPTATTPNRQVLQDQARLWLDRGLAVSRNNPGLVEAQASFFSSSVPGWLLQQGRDARPQGEAVRRELERAWDAGQGMGLAYALMASGFYARTCGLYGQVDNGPLLHALHLLQSRPLPAEDSGFLRSSLAAWAAMAAGPFLESGEDLRPLLEVVERSLVAGARAETVPEMLTLHLALADHALLTGGDAGPALAAAERAFRMRGEGAPRDERADLALAFTAARVRGDAESWAALEAQVLDPADAPPGGYGPPDPVLKDRARLLLARHFLEQGRDAGPLLKAARSALQAALSRRAGPPAHLLRERLAETCLLEGTAEALREGLREADRALEYARALDPAALARGPAVPADLGWEAPPHQGRTLFVKAELLLALAGREATLPARRAWAREASAAAGAAAARNRNLAREGTALQARARRLLETGRGSDGRTGLPTAPAPAHPGAGGPP